LEQEVCEGRFRSDLLARINLWDFQLPGLADRREDIEPNLDYELKCFAEKSGKHITFNKEARAEFMRYALDPETLWRGNFRDLELFSEIL
jgi:transcriptional regulatory protein RtcR